MLPFCDGRCVDGSDACFHAAEKLDEVTNAVLREIPSVFDM